MGSSYASDKHPCDFCGEEFEGDINVGFCTNFCEASYVNIRKPRVKPQAKPTFTFTAALNPADYYRQAMLNAIVTNGTIYNTVVDGQTIPLRFNQGDAIRWTNSQS